MIAPYVSRRHYWDHVEPTYEALPEALRAPVRAPGELAARLRNRGHRATTGTPQRAHLALVASGGDARALKPARVALVEHGAGQSYPIDDCGYSGGPGRDNVVLFLCPNEVVAQRNRNAYPGARVEVVGSPRVDALRSLVARPHGGGEATGPRGAAAERGSAPAVVALSFHFDSPMRTKAPEAGSALAHYRAALPGVVEALRRDGFEVLGHGHPRAAVTMARMWRRMGVEWVPDFAEVVRRAGIYVCDNSSTQPEFAAVTGRPVVFLNAPWYRRGLDAWWRFWAGVGEQVQVDGPAELVDGILLALSDPGPAHQSRVEMVRMVYGEIDGRAAERSAHALIETLGAVASPR